MFYDLVHVIALCQERNIPKVGNLLENVYSSNDTRDSVVMDFQTIRYVLGTGVVTDAARHNLIA